MSESPERARSVAIEGRFNFRDLGGYKTSDGRSLRWGRVYRSGVMSHISADGHAFLSKMNIRLVCDLRSTTERKAAPTEWQTAGIGTYWFRDYEMSDEIHQLMHREDHNAEEARHLMIKDYQTIAFEHKDSYRHLFQKIAEGHLPMVFNCSAGKDRTGVAAALLLTLLDVPRDTILADYALTNDVITQDLAPLAEKGLLTSWPTSAALKPLVSAEPIYLSTMFAAVEKEFGTTASFMHRELGIGRAEAEAIKNELLQRD